MYAGGSVASLKHPIPPSLSETGAQAPGKPARQTREYS